MAGPGSIEGSTGSFHTAEPIPDTPPRPPAGARLTRNTSEATQRAGGGQRGAAAEEAKVEIGSVFEEARNIAENAMARSRQAGSGNSIHGADDDGSIAVDIESGTVAPVDKSDLGRTQFGARMQRAALIDAVKTHAIMHPMVMMDPGQNAEMRANIDGLIADLDASLNAARQETADDGETKYFHVESGRDLTHLHAAKQKLEASSATLTESLGELTSAKDNLMEWKARQATGTTTKTDSLQRNVFGSELHAVFVRSALQSLLVVGATAGFQVGTVAMLQSFYTSNPDQIPEPILDEARTALGDGASNDAVVAKAIDDFVVPGSTYLDENTSSESAIYAAEAGVGGFRGAVVPMADSINETDARAKQIQGAIDTAEEPKVTKTPGERARLAMGNAWQAQVKANLVSGGIAALISTAATKQTTGLKVLTEVAKTMGFSAVSALNNVAADGVRKYAYDGNSEAVSQTIKAGARVAGRGVAQGIKMGVSYAQSAAAGEIDRRSPAGDAIKALVQFGLSGGMKEGLGAAAQNSTASHLPPNESAALLAGNAVGAIADFGRDLQGVTPEDLGTDGQAHFSDLIFQVESTLKDVMDANSVKFESIDFDTAHNVYATQLRDQVATQNATAGT